MSKPFEIPRCHWPPCKMAEMELLSETDGFWLFAHGCGTTRAISKPSTRDKSAYQNMQRRIEQIKEDQIRRHPTKVYSFSKGTR